MIHTRVCDCHHAACATIFVEVACVIVGETENVETCRAIEFGVTCWRAEQETGIRVAASLTGGTPIDKNAFEVTEGNVGGRQERCYLRKKTDAVIIREVILRVVRAEHHIANRSDADAHGRFGRAWRWYGCGSYDWRRRRFRHCFLLRWRRTGCNLQHRHCEKKLREPCWSTSHRGEYEGRRSWLHANGCVTCSIRPVLRWARYTRGNNPAR